MLKKVKKTKYLTQTNLISPSLKLFSKGLKKQILFKGCIVFLFFIFLFFNISCSHKNLNINKTSLISTNDNIKKTQNEKAKLNQTKPDDDDDILNEFDQEYDNKRTNKKKELVADPIEPVNRAIFQFNDKLYFWFLKPVATGYKFILPKIVRVGIKNFFHNLSTPVRLANSLLQGKWEGANSELGLFLANTTWGVFGFLNMESFYPDLHYSEEDLGQTLAYYGIGDGFYLVLPIFGPSTLRDGVGILGDVFIDPRSYIINAYPVEAVVGINAYVLLNNISLRLGDYETMKAASIEPYNAFKNAYIQYRLSEIAK